MAGSTMPDCDGIVIVQVVGSGDALAAADEVGCLFGAANGNENLSLLTHHVTTSEGQA